MRTTPRAARILICLTSLALLARGRAAGQSNDCGAAQPLEVLAGPTVSSVAPSSGPAAGNVDFAVLGSGYQPGATATLGGSAATRLVPTSVNQINGSAPALSAGTLNAVVVTNPDTSTASLAGAYFADFTDVARFDMIHPFVERLVRAAITGGCGGGQFCPDSPVTRAQMAVFLLRGEHGAAYTPPACTGLFTDVACTPTPAFAVNWIEQLHNEGITAGCSTNMYCPGSPVTRAQMSVLLLRSARGPSFVPPPCTGLFSDVPCSSAYAAWIEELFHAGVTGGCGTSPLRYCPSATVTRGQMAVFLSAMFVLPPPPSSKYDWPQFDVDARHSGHSFLETTISRRNVATLQQLFSVPLPEIADGAPAVAVGIVTPGGTKDLVLDTTMAGRLTARDARTGAAVWATTPPTGPKFTTSSPALDPSRQYVYSYALDGFVHKYNIGDGSEVTTGGWPELTTLKPDVEKGSSALTLGASGGAYFLYVANGGYPGDAGDYQGHVTTVRLSSGAQNVFNANCSDRTIHFDETGSPTTDCSHVQSAVWARQGVVLDDRTGRIYAATGNGDYDANTGGHDWGDSVFALAPDGKGAAGGPLDSYTPVNFQALQNGDLDLGSTAPALLPVRDTRRVSALALQGGKEALRLIDVGNLSGQGGPGHVGGELQAFLIPQGGEVLTAPAVWVNPQDLSTWVFVTTGSGIAAFKLVFDASGNPSVVMQWSAAGGTSPIVVNGLLFYASSNRIAALDPTTGSVLWSDTGIGPIHWESPAVANGILYITDGNGMLNAYSPGGVAPP